MRILNHISIVILIPLLLGCIKDVSGVKNISVEDLKEVIKKEKSIQILDVRLPSETKTGMILNAINVNLISNNFESQYVNILDKDKPVYVYCYSGTRSKIASKILIDKGYQVFSVEGGYKNWLKEQ